MPSSLFPILIHALIYNVNQITAQGALSAEFFILEKMYIKSTPKHHLKMRPVYVDAEMCVHKRSKLSLPENKDMKMFNNRLFACTNRAIRNKM